MITADTCTALLDSKVTSDRPEHLRRDGVILTVRKMFSPGIDHTAKMGVTSAQNKPGT